MDEGVVDKDVVAQWAPDWLWEVAAPLIPAAPLRPQGGGRRRVDDRRLLAAVLYLAQTGQSWWLLPEAAFGVTRATAHRRFTEWSAAGLWDQLHRVVTERLATADIDAPAALLDAIVAQAAMKDSGRAKRRRQAPAFPATPDHH